jgi:solute carrier family 10 (sodium/bile acid cotransporter), member 7
MNRASISRYWFLAALIMLIPVGILAPEPGLALKNSGWVIPVFVGVMLGIAGFTMDTSSLVKQAANFHAVIPVLLSIYLFSPALAYGLGVWFAPAGNEHFLPAMMIMAAQAGSLASAIALTMMSGGNRELALICTLASNSLTFLLTPFILNMSIGADVDFHVGEMMLRMLYMVLLPIAAGQLLRPLLWARTEAIRPFIRIAPQIIILMFVYTGFASGAKQLQGTPEIVLRFFAACAILHLALLAWNYLLSGWLLFEWPDRTAMMLSGSQKTLPNGIYVWSNFFATNPYGAVPLVLYHLFQLLVDTLLVPWFEKRNLKDGESCVTATFSCHGAPKR